MIIWNANGVLKPGIENASNRDKDGLNNNGARKRLLLLVVKKLLLLVPADEKNEVLPAAAEAGKEYRGDREEKTSNQAQEQIQLVKDHEFTMYVKDHKRMEEAT